jgi:hypothetical protein
MIDSRSSPQRLSRRILLDATLPPPERSSDTCRTPLEPSMLRGIWLVGLGAAWSLRPVATSLHSAADYITNPCNPQLNFARPAERSQLAGRLDIKPRLGQSHIMHYLANRVYSTYLRRLLWKWLTSHQRIGRSAGDFKTRFPGARSADS